MEAFSVPRSRYVIDSAARLNTFLFPSFRASRDEKPRRNVGRLEWYRGADYYCSSELKKKKEKERKRKEKEGEKGTRERENEKKGGKPLSEKNLFFGLSAVYVMQKRSPGLCLSRAINEAWWRLVTPEIYLFIHAACIYIYIYIYIIWENFIISYKM